MRFKPDKIISDNNKGQSTLEFVMVIPLIIMLILAAAQIGLMVYSRMQVQQASREAAGLSQHEPIVSIQPVPQP